MNGIHMKRFRNIPPLQYLLGFEAAARLESFSKAAEELGLSQSAISHEMRLLEARVGQPLFIRQGRSIRLTDAGRDYQRSVARSLEQLEAGYRRLEPFRKPGSVVIYTQNNFAARWLLPRLSHLQATVPLCEPWIDTSGAEIDFEEMELSIAIVQAREIAPHLISHLLFADVLIPVAAPSLIKNHPRTPTDLTKYPLIHDEQPEGWNEWFESAGVALEETSTGLDFSDSELALQAAIEGYGIALASQPLVQKLLLDKKLVQISVESVQTGRNWFAVSTAKELLEPITLDVWRWLKSTANADIG